MFDPQHSSLAYFANFTSSDWVGLATTLAMATWSVRAVKQRLELSAAKHPSLTGHSRWAKRLTRWIPGYHYRETEFFGCDGASELLVVRRRKGFRELAASFAERFPKTNELTRQARANLPDLQFTSAYRVPFQYSTYLREHLSVGAFLRSSDGVMVVDIDGNRLFDLAGSYGVNLFGHDFYKTCIAEGAELVKDLGPVLGAYHPTVLYNIQCLKEISGLDEVSFHMSGTEAVMQAVRLARYHTRRSHLVRFCGAYHGWWDDVQPGPGNPAHVRDTYTLRDMHVRSLHVLQTRKDIACVLVNPLQALHPNTQAPGDSALLDSSRKAGFDREAYTAWLHTLREVCTQRGIVLIFDEVFLGFRLAPGGAQAYFGVKADLVTYGKTLGGGLPVGVVCGKAALMQRFRPERPADICFARGTFNAHPYVMGAMTVFLQRLRQSQILKLYEGLDELWNGRAAQLNQALALADLPVRVANLSSVWTITYTQASRYNWMFQFYLRLHGIALSWVGSGRMIFSLNYTDADFAEVSRRFLDAAKQMQREGWWSTAVGASNKSIRRSILKEALSHRM